MTDTTPPQFDGRAFINGDRVAALDGQTFDCISPVDGRLLTTVARSGEADVNAAVAAARAAFEDRRWSGMAPAQRKRVMIKFADLVSAAGDELALTEALDMGKPVKYAKGVDVNAAANCIRWYGEAVDKVYDEIAPTADTALALITRQPVGVVGVIVPWNYPMIMAAWKIAPALAAGNSVVLKPSEKSPLTALRLAELALAAGIPAGVFNVVPGFGPEAGSPAGAAHGCGLHRLHGLDAGGQEDPRDGGAEQPEARLDRAGRQVAQHRVRRLPRSGPRGGSRCGQHLLQPGRELQRAFAFVRGREHQGRLPGKGA